MSKINNPPAFPNTQAVDYIVTCKKCGEKHDYQTTHAGMTLHDWFAGMAMQGMLANKRFVEAISALCNDNQELCIKMTATIAYKHADAMLTEREKERV